MRRHLVAWGFPPRELAGLREAEAATVAAPEGLDGLRAVLAADDWDAVAIRADGDVLRAAADVVRAAPPLDALFLVGDDVLEVFPDAAQLPYDVWVEPDARQAPAIFARLLESLRASAALAALQTQRALQRGLRSVLRHDRPVEEAMEDAMILVAAELGCTGAAFWRVSSSGRDLNRVACTGPLPALDDAATGDGRRPQGGCDRLLTMPMHRTRAGDVVRTGEPWIGEAAQDGMILPAATGGDVSAVLVLLGAEAVARRRTTFETATTTADQLAAFVSLRDAEHRYYAVTGSSTDAVVLADATGNVIGFNVGAERVFRQPADAVLDRQVRRLFDDAWWDEQEPLVRAIVRRVRRGEPSDIQQGPVRLADGSTLHAEVSLSTWSEGEDRRYACILRDVSERHHAEQRIVQLAFTDPVTGLANQPAMCRYIDTLDGDLTLLTVEVGRVRTVRATLGSDAAEDLLRGIAGRIVAVLGAEGEAFHRGGETFFVLAAAAAQQQAEALGERILRATQAPMEVSSTELRPVVRVTAVPSTGLEGDSRAPGLVDRALRAAASTLPGFHGAEQLGVEAQLRRGIDRGELRLVFQPVIDLVTRRMRGVEALVRWQHPTRGLLAPGAFVPLAEETDLILDLGRWVAEAACRQAERWQRAGLDLDVGFNLSARQLVDARGVRELIETIDGSHADHRRLVVEVTETSALHDFVSSNRTLEQLRARGIRVALDDFGVGESSLSRLAQLPVDLLKIDRSFVQGLPDDRAARALAESAIGLAHGLGIRPHAEGIETAAQASWLMHAGCHDGQGFLFSRPVSAERIEALAVPDTEAAATSGSATA